MSKQSHQEFDKLDTIIDNNVKNELKRLREENNNELLKQRKLVLAICRLSHKSKRNRILKQKTKRKQIFFYIISKLYS